MSGGNGRPSNPLRVLLVCDHIDHDGALHGGGRQLIELLRELEETQTVEPIACILRGSSDLGRSLVQEGLPLTFFGDHRFSPRSLFRLLRVIRDREIDVLHLTDFGGCTWGRVASRLTGRPNLVQVITHHSEYQPRGYPRYVEMAYRAMARWTDRALAISPSVREFAVTSMGFSPDEVEVLPYPLPKHSVQPADPASIAEVRERHGIPSDAPLVGAVTRLHPAKGIEFLIRAWGTVLEAAPNAYLVLVGQGPLEEDLRSLARESGVGDRVVFAGFQRDVAAYVGAFDIAAVPSLEEGFGLVALEALALGCPVVASRVGGLSGIVEDGRTGRLVPPADPSALAGALVELLGDSKLRDAMGRRGRESSQRFRLPDYVDRLEEIYNELEAQSG